jgi:hypothetical protein
MMTITVYRDSESGHWVFDDEARGLKREPLVRGTDRILDEIRLRMSTGPGVPESLVLVFSGQAFPGSRFSFHRRQYEAGGCWYEWMEEGMRGWLCPALFRYFDEAPDILHLSATPLSIGRWAHTAAFEVEDLRTIRALERRLAEESRFTVAEMRQWRERLRTALETVELL